MSTQLAQLGRLAMAPLTWYNRTAQKHPFAVGVITTGLKTSAADWFAQKVRARARAGGHGAAAAGPSTACRAVAAASALQAGEQPRRAPPSPPA